MQPVQGRLINHGLHVSEQPLRQEMISHNSHILQIVQIQLTVFVDPK